MEWSQSRLCSLVKWKLHVLPQVATTAKKLVWLIKLALIVKFDIIVQRLKVKTIKKQFCIVPPTYEVENAVLFIIVKIFVIALYRTSSPLYPLAKHKFSKITSNFESASPCTEYWDQFCTLYKWFTWWYPCWTQKIWFCRYKQLSDVEIYIGIFYIADLCNVHTYIKWAMSYEYILSTQYTYT